MIAYHAHEIPHPERCLCRFGSARPCNTIDLHPIAICDGTIPGIVRALTDREKYQVACAIVGDIEGWES